MERSVDTIPRGPYRWQLELYASTAERKVVLGTRQGGKSYGLAFLSGGRAVGMQIAKTKPKKSPDGSKYGPATRPDGARVTENASGWMLFRTYTGDPRIDGRLTDTDLDYLKTVARQQGVYSKVRWTDEPAWFWTKTEPARAQNVYYVSVNEDRGAEWATEYIEEKLAPALDLLCPAQKGRRGKTKDGAVGQYIGGQVVFSNGKAIHVLTSSSSSARGMHGMTLLDEAAYPPDSVSADKVAEMVQALTGAASRGYDNVIVSTHNGPDTVFAHECAHAKTAMESGDPDFYFAEVNIFQVALQGGRYDEGRRRGQILDPDHLRRKSKSDAYYRQDYLCEPLRAGACVFDRAALDALRSRVSAPKSWFYFVGGEMRRLPAKPAPDQHKFVVTLWNEPRPGVEYAIGADIASGGEGESASRGGTYKYNHTAFDVTVADPSLSTVCEVCGFIEPLDAAVALAALGNYFNHALLVPERNSYGLTVVKWLLALDERRKTHNYLRHRLFVADRGAAVKAGLSAEYGVFTAGDTRATMFAGLMYWVNRKAGAGVGAWPNADTLDEAEHLAEVNGKIQADSHNGKDDRMIAKALSIYGIEQWFRRGLLQQPMDIRASQIAAQRAEVESLMHGESNDRRGGLWGFGGNARQPRRRGGLYGM